MSGFSSHGVGAALCAKAEVESAASAAASKRLLVENRVILSSPGIGPKKFGVPPIILNKSRTSLLRQYDDTTSRFAAVRHSRLWDLPPPASRLCSGSGLDLQ